MTALLEVRGLSTVYATAGGFVQAVRDASFTLQRGEILGMTGPSGSGKSALARSVLGLEESEPGVIAGSIRFLGRELLCGLERCCERGEERGVLRVSKDRAAWQARVRANYSHDVRIRMAGLFQHPEVALDPFSTLRVQVGRAIRHRARTTGRTGTRGETAGWLERVALVPAERFLDRYPFELSGGERQRGALACAAAGRPEILVADEPTSNLDVFSEAEVMGLIRALAAEESMAVLLISHRLDMLQVHCHKLAAMSEGAIRACGDPGEVVRDLGWQHLEVS